MKIEIARLDDPDFLAVYILKHWDEDRIKKFACHLLGDKCVQCYNDGKGGDEIDSPE